MLLRIDTPFPSSAKSECSVSVLALNYLKDSACATCSLEENVGLIRNLHYWFAIKICLLRPKKARYLFYTMIMSHLYNLFAGVPHVYFICLFFVSPWLYWHSSGTSNRKIEDRLEYRDKKNQFGNSLHSKT